MEGEKKRGGWWAWCVVVLMTALVVYPLSIGPVFLLYNKLGGPEWLPPVLDAFYSPVPWVLDRLPPWAWKWYMRYEQWWI